MGQGVKIKYKTRIIQVRVLGMDGWLINYFFKSKQGVWTRLRFGRRGSMVFSTRDEARTYLSTWGEYDFYELYNERNKYQIRD